MLKTKLIKIQNPLKTYYDDEMLAIKEIQKE